MVEFVPAVSSADFPEFKLSNDELDTLRAQKTIQAVQRVAQTLGFQMGVEGANISKTDAQQAGLNSEHRVEVDGEVVEPEMYIARGYSDYRAVLSAAFEVQSVSVIYPTLAAKALEEYGITVDVKESK
jgi:hypothetical protein